MRMIFVNLPVKDVAASRRFFGALGFAFNEQFSDENTLCVKISDTIYTMLLAESRFRDFITGEISDTAKGTEVLLALSCDSRDEVDRTLKAAMDAGARPWKPVMDLGFMYGASFQDLDGHVWELFYMDPAHVEPQPA